MKASVDIYTVKQASLALGVSPKRVRQLIEEGKLKVHSREPITVKQVEVILLKDQRQHSKRINAYEGRRVTSDSALLEQIKTLIEASVTSHRLAIETAETAAKRNEENLIAQINDLKAEVESLKARRWSFRARK